MPAVSKEQALELLTREVENTLPADEIVEIHNELFPASAVHPGTRGEAVQPLRARLRQHLHQGWPPEMIAELWALIVPSDRQVWYNEEEELIHYREKFDDDGMADYSFAE